MGWLKLGFRDPPPEIVSTNADTPPKCPFASSSVSDSELPFIPPDEVARRVSAVAGGLFVVVDEVVSDCTQFIYEHPGGQQVIESFAGAECGWQFWRFHGKKEMEEFGRALRVGRTKGLQNKYEEPAKYVGLKRLGDDRWD